LYEHDDGFPDSPVTCMYVESKLGNTLTYVITCR